MNPLGLENETVNEIIIYGTFSICVNFFLTVFMSDKHINNNH